VIVVDANVLIYAHNMSDPRFAAAKEWLQGALTGRETIGLPWAVIHAFLRLTTSTRALPTPFSIRDATGIVSEWLGLPAVRPLDAGPRYWTLFRNLVHETDVRGKILSDAHIAALAIENDATVATTDRDFARFPNVRVFNPLV
jgi:toxin-antitoxin system PIN domain toxin